MTSREESNALTHVRELLAKDLSQVSTAELMRGVTEAEMLYDESQKWVGRLVAELRRREPPLSWAQLSKVTGVPAGTLRRRAEKAAEAEVHSTRDEDVER